MKVRNLLAALSLMLVGVQALNAQKMLVKLTDKQYAEYDVSQVELVTFVDGYVDLGLPSGTLWATCNVGASSPEDFGEHFAWGETQPKQRYAWDTYFDTEDGKTFNKYNNDGGLTELQSEDDAATANFGEGWRIPSKAQIEELANSSYTTTVWTTQNGVNGLRVTGKNGNSIFLPAAGFCNGIGVTSGGSMGFYCTSSLNTNNSNTAEIMHFISSGFNNLFSGRQFGFSIRPVVYQKAPKLVTEIVLNNTSLSMSIDDTQMLTATVLPENATYKTLLWDSNNRAVATVSKDGFVTAIKKGTATITCIATDGSGKKAACQVNVLDKTFKACPDNNHPHVIDLGLEWSNWACCNIGASSPLEYGNYYAWGETAPKSVYTRDTYAYYDHNTYSYTIVGNDPGPWYVGVDGTEYDAAVVNWGNNGWQMPSTSLQRELVEKCSREWTQLNGVNGILVTGPNGGQIFLPRWKRSHRCGRRRVLLERFVWR